MTQRFAKRTSPFGKKEKLHFSAMAILAISPRYIVAVENDAAVGMGWRGRSMAKTHPHAGRSRAVRVPEFASTLRRAIDSPSPRPVLFALLWLNGWNIFSRSPFGLVEKEGYAVVQLSFDGSGRGPLRHFISAALAGRKRS